MHRIDLDEARQQLPALLEAAINGEEIIITRDNQPLVKLTRLQPDRTEGSAAGRVWMSDDFNDSLEDYSDEIP